MVFVAVVLRVVPACSLANHSIFKTNCERDEVVQLSSPKLITAQLLERINQLEKKILNDECSYASFDEIIVEETFEVPEVIADNEPEPEPEPTPEVQEEILTESEVEAWNENRISGFSGCWEVRGSSQSFVPVGCEIDDCPSANSSNATYCFDQNGFGDVKTEIAGKYCRANIKAEFKDQQSGSQSLNFSELAGQKCADNTKFSDGSSFTSIVARNYKCKLTNQKSIKCSTENSAGKVGNNISLVRKNDE